MNRAKSILDFIGGMIMLFIVMDLLMLSCSMAQIALEGKTGYWNPFWSWQAEQVIQVAQIVSGR